MEPSDTGQGGGAMSVLGVELTTNGIRVVAFDAASDLNGCQ